MEMGSSLVLLLSIVLILLLIRKLHPSIAVFLGALFLSVLSLPIQEIPDILLRSILNWETLRLMIIVVSAMTLSAAMEVRGLLANLAKAMEAFGPKKAMHIVPAMIGFVSMPAGALVSAAAVKGTAERLKLKPEEATFINYWFRHVWEFSMPVYQSIVIVSVVLGWQLSSVFLTLVPLTFLAILIGLPMSLKILKDRDGGGGRFPLIEFIKAAWPILLLVVLILGGVEPALVFPSSLILLLVQQKFKPRELVKPLKYGLNPKILFSLYSIMVFKFIIEASESAMRLFEDIGTLGVPMSLMLVVLPFILALGGGSSIALAGLSFPLLVPIISEMGGKALMLAYASGMVGLLLSPLHLCLILSTEFFKAKLSKVYGYVLPPVLAMEVAALLLFIL